MAQINILLKLLNAIGSVINPATEDTLNTVRLDLDHIDTTVGGQGDAKTANTVSGKLAKIRDTQHPLERYRNHDEDDPGTGVTYFGFLATDGTWYVLKEDASANPVTRRYANLSNNSTITGGYSGSGADKAWINRATLSYGYLNALTGL